MSPQPEPDASELFAKHLRVVAVQPGRPVAPQPLHQRNAFHTGIGFTGNALAYVFVVGIAGLFVALLALECAMVARERAGGPPARAAATRVVAS